MIVFLLTSQVPSPNLGHFSPLFSVTVGAAISLSITFVIEFPSNLSKYDSSRNVMITF